MRRIPLFLAVAALSAFPAGAQVKARPIPAQQQPKSSIVKQRVVSSIFEQESPLDAQPISFAAPGQLTHQDKLQEADAESAIAKDASYAGIDFPQGKWSYRQIACPAFPNHLFLRFTRNRGKGDVSIFTASIPRNGQGQVRIIPIERRGYSMFSPAPTNALTIADFNHIRAEEHAAPPTSWVGIGLCYAALAGANLANQDHQQDGSQEISSILSLAGGGGAVLRFNDMTAAPGPIEWALFFDRKGRLVKSSAKPAGISGPKTVPAGHTPVPVRVAQPGTSAAPIPPA